ncbi:hypothetical protein MPER_02295, partial [Moniliophthora perniciosa FA553]
PYTLRPFIDPEIEKASSLIEKQCMKDFNYTLSKQQITVKHAFGALKGCFPSLRFLGSHRDVNDNWRVIEALMILHNICLYYNDHPELIDDFVIVMDTRTQDDHEDIPPASPTPDMESLGLPLNETDAWLQEKGHKLHKEILDSVFPIENYL